MFLILCYIFFPLLITSLNFPIKADFFNLQNNSSVERTSIFLRRCITSVILSSTTVTFCKFFYSFLLNCLWWIISDVVEVDTYTLFWWVSSLLTDSQQRLLSPSVKCKNLHKLLHDLVDSKHSYWAIYVMTFLT